MSTWGDIAADVAKAAPILGNLLPGVGTIAGAGVGAVASIVASALGTTPDPDAVKTALANDPEAYAKLKQAELDNKATLATLALQREQAQLAADTAQLATVNQTMQSETNSPDAYVRRWRATWGYISAVSFAVVSVFVLYLMVMGIHEHDAAAIAAVPGVITAFVMLFGVPGAILGIHTWKQGSADVERAKGTPAS